MMTANPMVASAAAIPMMKRVKICPVVGSGAKNLLKAIKLSPAPFRINSTEINIPIKVRL
jgi:hypothetical protein